MDALWSSVKDLDKVLTSDEAAATATLKLLSSTIKPDLPPIVRPDVVRDACALLVAPSEKPLIERVRFLTFQEVRLNEISLALRMLPILPVLKPEDVIKAARHYRVDMVEAAESFFKADAVRNQTLEDKITFLQRQKELSNVEIDEALDRAGIEVLVDPESQIRQQRSSVNPEEQRKAALMRVAKEFLQSDAASKATPEEIVETLKKLGLTDEDIKQVQDQMKRAEEKRPELLARARRFLTSPATKVATEEQVDQFLMKEGLKLEDIKMLRSELAATASSSPSKPTLDSSSSTTHQSSPQQPTSSPPQMKPELDGRIKQAVNFLRSVPRQSSQAEAFLKSKGYTQDEITQAVALAGATVEDDTKIEQAVKFLQTPQATNAGNDDAVDQFLLKKGFTQNEIDEARRRANRPKRPSNHAPTSSNSNSNVDRALMFLRNPATRGTSMEEKVNFLRSKGLSDEEIKQAFDQFEGSAPSALSTNSTSAAIFDKQHRRQQVVVGLIHNITTSSSPTATSSGVVVVPGLATMTVLAMDKLAAFSTKIQTTPFIFQRAIFASTVLTCSKSVLRLPNRYVLKWIPLLRKWVMEAEQHIFLNKTKNEAEMTSEEGELFENLVAELLETCGAGVDSTCFTMALELTNEIVQSTITPDPLGAILSLSRCVHGHFMARASHVEYERIREIFEHSPNDFHSPSLYTASAGAMLRGSVDFGCGVGAPRVPMEEKTAINVLPEKLLRERMSVAASNSSGDRKLAAHVGVGCIYAGKVWLDSEETCGCICETLFSGALEVPFRPESNLDDNTKLASVLINKSMFKLAASVAQLIVSQCGDGGESVRTIILNKINRHCSEVFEKMLQNTQLSGTFAKRVIERTYDEQKSQLSLEDVLGTHANLAKFFQTQYLVAVVLIEACLRPDTPMDAVSRAWTNIAALGFALVPTPEAIKLNKWMELLIKFADEDNGFSLLARACDVGQLEISKDNSSSSVIERENVEEATKDWVTAAKLEYLMDTGKQILRPGWEKYSLHSAQEFVKLDSPPNVLAKAIIYGASHPFSMLNHRCHSLATDAIRKASSSSSSASEKQKQQQKDSNKEEEQSESSLTPPPPPLALVIVPRYILRSTKSCPVATDAAGMAFVVGNVMTSLSMNDHPLAQSIAASSYFRLVAVLQSLLMPPDAPTREMKTRADLIASLAFASLKALSLTALPLCLEKLESLFQSATYREMTGRMVSLDTDRLRKSLIGVISRIDDSSRRAVLVMWFLSRIQTGHVSDDDDDGEQGDPADIGSEEDQVLKSARARL